MCPPFAPMFMTNNMLLWWTLDSVPLPTQSSRKLPKKLFNGDPIGEGKCEVSSIKPKWQVNWTHNAITSFFLNRSFVRRTTDLEKTDNKNRLDRKSTRLNSSHTVISYAVFCLKKNKPKRPAYKKYPKWPFNKIGWLIDWFVSYDPANKKGNKEASAH